MNLRGYVAGVGAALWMAAGGWLSAQEVPGADPVPAEPASTVTNLTVITSQSMVYDYEEAVAIFEGNVQVDDPGLRLWTDKLTVAFDGANQVRSLEALGHVKFERADGSGASQKAEYAAVDGKMTLTGEAVLHRDEESIMADVITFLFVDDHIQSVRATGRVRVRRAGDSAEAGAPSLFPGARGGRER